ncbi:MAG: alpha/beta hydrolase [Actinobacteria bacterium]|nr:alpha/beta hydrolase [Actinomycetota bacterium]MBU1943174.1 alpha/beta hydrolase [Actinomycetota bacterium]MBU2687852.1 alpha/beta hydrolase [Actinomycetota bacterium]
MSVDDIEVAFRSFGSGFPLVLVIGLGSSMELWDEGFTGRLAERYCVVTFENRGIGGTGRGSEPFTIRRFAADLAGLLDALGLERAHLLGYSMGGYIVQELALTQPDRVAGLVLLATDCGQSGTTSIGPAVLEQLSEARGQMRPERLKRLLFPARWLKDNERALIGAFASYLEGGPDPVVVRKQAEAMAAWKGTCPRLSELRAPTLVITGTEDVVITPDNSVVLSEICGASLVRVEGGGHGLLLQYPRELADIVLGFLDGLNPSM